MMDLAEDIEQNLYLMGATGMEQLWSLKAKLSNTKINFYNTLKNFSNTKINFPPQIIIKKAVEDKL
jgi:hypothetical protein